MKHLETLGIISGNDLQHRYLADPKKYEPSKFFDTAFKLLKQASPIVLEKVVPFLENYPGRWNPGGFMVFPLGLMEDSSSLRLHVSAANLPRNILDGPFIHNHGWHLASQVIAGEYSDTIFDIKRQPSDIKTNAEKGVFRLYETKRNPGGLDELVTDGAIVKALPVKERHISEGNFHRIEAITVYHLPTTPSEQLAATLVLDSPAFVNSTYVLIDNKVGKTIFRRRLVVDRESVEIAKEQLLHSNKN